MSYSDSLECHLQWLTLILLNTFSDWYRSVSCTFTLAGCCKSLVRIYAIQIKWFQPLEGYDKHVSTPMQILATCLRIYWPHIHNCWVNKCPWHLGNLIRGTSHCFNKVGGSLYSLIALSAYSTWCKRRLLRQVEYTQSMRLHLHSIFYIQHQWDCFIVAKTRNSTTCANKIEIGQIR